MKKSILGHHSAKESISVFNNNHKHTISDHQHQEKQPSGLNVRIHHHHLLASGTDKHSVRTTHKRGHSVRRQPPGIIASMYTTNIQRRNNSPAGRRMLVGGRITLDSFCFCCNKCFGSKLIVMSQLMPPDQNKTKKN